MNHKLLFVILVLIFIHSAHGKKKHFPLQPIQANTIGDFVKEPSGATFSEITQTLFIICDKPSCHYIYEMSTAGKKIRAWKYHKQGHDDVEAVATDDENRVIYIAEEGALRITAFTLPVFEDKDSYHLTEDDDQYHLNELRSFVLDIDDIRGPYEKEEKSSSRPGLEGMTYNSREGVLMVANEKKPMIIFRIDPMDGTVISHVETSYSKDLSGLCYDPLLDKMWVVSDKSERLFLTNTDGSVVYDKWDLNMQNPEGVAVDNLSDPPLIFITTDPSSPHGKQFVPALYVFEKPLEGSGLEFHDDENPPEYHTVSCQGCSTLYSEIDAALNPHSDSDPQSPRTYVVVLYGLEFVFMSFLFAGFFLAVALIIAWRVHRIKTASKVVDLEMEETDHTPEPEEPGAIDGDTIITETTEDPEDATYKTKLVPHASHENFDEVQSSDEGLSESGAIDDDTITEMTEDPEDATCKTKLVPHASHENFDEVQSSDEGFSESDVREETEE